MAGNNKMNAHREEVEQMWEDGFSIDEIAKRFDVTIETARSNFKLWGMDYKTNEIKPLMIAKPKPFKKDVVMVEGKPMVDVTQFCVDCGGGGYAY